VNWVAHSLVHSLCDLNANQTDQNQSTLGMESSGPDGLFHGDEEHSESISVKSSGKLKRPIILKGHLKTEVDSAFGSLMLFRAD
jgi:hypothetical protein